MINSIYAYLCGLLLMILWCIRSRKKQYPDGYILLVCGFILYLTVVAAITLFPVVYNRSLMQPGDNPQERIRLIPFEIIQQYLFLGDPFAIAVQIGGNVLMTVPFGIILPLLKPKKSLWFYIAAALLFPLCIELLQLLLDVVLQTFYRTADIDDVILNTSGILSGYGICRLLPLSWKEKCRRNSSSNEENINASGH